MCFVGVSRRPWYRMNRRCRTAPPLARRAGEGAPYPGARKGFSLDTLEKRECGLRVYPILESEEAAVAIELPA